MFPPQDIFTGDTYQGTLTQDRGIYTLAIGAYARGVLEIVHVRGVYLWHVRETVFNVQLNWPDAELWTPSDEKLPSLEAALAWLIEEDIDLIRFVPRGLVP